MIEQTFWKYTKQNKHFRQQAGNITADPPAKLWLFSKLYSLKKEDQEIVLSKQEWLNDSIMDAAQKLVSINFSIRTQFTKKSHYHSNQLHKTMFNFFTRDPIISFLSFCSKGRVQICDSLYIYLTWSSKKSIQPLFKHIFSLLTESMFDHFTTWIGGLAMDKFLGYFNSHL